MGPLQPTVLEVTPQIRIPLGELVFTFARSSGPGGQNVNKVNSKATLHWPISSASLPDDVRARFVAAFGGQINKQGELVLQSQRFRDQERNIEDCLEKLRGMLQRVATPPKRRKKTRPSRASKQRRLNDKKARSEVKSRRSGPSHE
ncbi:MAG: aminoacyl-tRNA hydrolase [Pirellulaceae bacterium]|nr:aminoacyl-tRNA hydrolase [Pirellulaceae bacterium]